MSRWRVTPRMLVYWVVGSAIGVLVMIEPLRLIGLDPWAAFFDHSTAHAVIAGVLLAAWLMTVWLARAKWQIVVPALAVVANLVFHASLVRWD